MNMLTEQQTETNQTNDRKYLVPFILITSLFFLWGLRSCHSGCTQQALPECSAHQYYSFRPYSGYHLSGLFPDGNTCWLFYQPLWLSPWRGLWSAPLWCGRLALYPGCCGGQFLSIPALPFHYRVRSGVPGNSRQSLCYRTGCQGNSYQPTELIAVV